MIGNRIKSARRLRKKTQQWLAEEIGVHQTSVTQWETGRTDPTTENLSRIAQVLDVSFEWLAKGTGEMSSAPMIPARTVPAELAAYEHFSDEQRDFLRLFDALPKSKRAVLMTFMKEWVK